MARKHIFFDHARPRGTGSGTAFAPSAFALAEQACLANVLGALEDLAEDLHVPDRKRRAAVILDYLRRDLARYIRDEEAVVALLGRMPPLPEAVHESIGEVRSEHRVLRSLLGPVMDGLEEIAAVGLPLSPQGFVISALILCEFLRMHVCYAREVLLPLMTAAWPAVRA